MKQTIRIPVTVTWRGTVHVHSVAAPWTEVHFQEALAQALRNKTAPTDEVVIIETDLEIKGLDKVAGRVVPPR